MASKKETGALFFDAYYSNVYKERWSVLKNALMQEHEGRAVCHQGKPSYFLDEASIAAACALPVDNACSVLDLCAAPGGKTVVLSHLIHESTKLQANELSADRRTRLIKVINDHIPDTIRQMITVTPYDGSIMYKKNKETFDSILLDAPCSSERHVLKSSSHLSQWSKARIRNVTYTQWSLLSAAFLMLKQGGYLLYSTCALAPDENDGVITKLCNKYTDAQIISINWCSIKNKCKQITGDDSLIKPEHTSYGVHILPDSSMGSGPLYFCLIKKTNMTLKKLDEI